MGMFIVYFLIVLLLPLYAQMKVKSTYKKFAKVPAEKGMTGAQVARYILDQHGLADVRVVPTQGVLADHYNPTTKTVALSEDNYYNSSLAGTAVAAHEVGHAIQHSEAYSFLTFRSKLVPVASFASNFSWIFVIIGMLAQLSNLLLIGIVLLAAGVVFQLITLPVEFDASKRAMNEVVALGIINNTEERSARKVLNAAAMTYVAAASVAVLELLRLILIYTGMGNSDD
ncbi:Zn-dependent protease [Lysinibacillus sp. 2017]|uniref:zinc metallopeptidase n=1 Tax=unclassified Lysinibacillus TaxID=2636778 RepID=UPI000D5294A5|nr:MULTISPECIES: zinc metallopeptidase [unclassified Lysinibacillus]AWE07007.1 Zn-dependent protease [Lysinibacillus sp. 2017]TGN37069.1 zinc metallopeptidase [Lysinibacillus sp. S2017]